MINQTIYNITRLILFLTAFSLAHYAHAEQYVDQATFLQQTFAPDQPKASKYWLDKEDKQVAQNILGHEFRQLRVRYWHEGPKSAWILEEIGKVKPITIGVVVKEGQIDSITILAFRESRGWEVKYPFFTQQFNGASLGDEHQLSKNIDGITGATLSVRAVTKVARLALHLAGKTSVKSRAYAKKDEESP